jgi:hypothetical protein
VIGEGFHGGFSLPGGRRALARLHLPTCTAESVRADYSIGRFATDSPSATPPSKPCSAGAPHLRGVPPLRGGGVRSSLDKFVAALRSG